MANVFIQRFKQWREALVALLTVTVSSFTKLISAYPGVLLIIFSSLAIISLALLYLIKEEKIKAILKGICTFSAVFAVSFLAVFFIHKHKLSKVNSNELVYEMTQEAASNRISDIPWVTESALLADSIAFIATKSCSDNLEDDLGRVVIDLTDDDKLEDLERRMKESRFVVDKLGVVDNKYVLIITLKDVLKSVLPKGYTLLPYSTALSVVGVRRANAYDWSPAKECLMKAEDEGNAFSTYMLARMNIYGFGQEPDIPEGTKRLKTAAEKGFQAAQYEWAHEILFDEHSSTIDKATAEEFLIMATKMIDFRSVEGLIVFWQSVSDLLKYYSIREDNINSYLLTRRLCKDYHSYMAPIPEHIENCIKLHLYSEAKRFIRQCERQPKTQLIENNHQQVYVIHSKMYQHGLGFPKDLRRAESLLRYASDSLDYNPARNALREFYKEHGYNKEATFYGRLYDARFSYKLIK